MNIPTMVRQALCAPPQTSNDAIFITSMVVAFLSGAFFIDWLCRGYECEVQKGYHDTQMRFLREQFGKMEHLPSTCNAIENGQKDIVKSLGKFHEENSNKKSEILYPDVPARDGSGTEIMELQTRLSDIQTKLADAEKARDDKEEASKEVATTLKELKDEAKKERRKSGKQWELHSDQTAKESNEAIKTSREAIQKRLKDFKEQSQESKAMVEAFTKDMRQRVQEVTAQSEKHQRHEDKWGRFMKEKDERIAALNKEKENIEEAHKQAVSRHNELSVARAGDLESARRELSNTRERLAQYQAQVSGLTQEKKDLEGNHERVVKDNDSEKEAHVRELKRVGKELESAQTQLAQNEKQVTAVIKEKETLEETCKRAAETANAASAQELALVESELNETKQELQEKEREINRLEDEARSREELCDLSETQNVDLEKRISELEDDSKRKVELEKELQDTRDQLDEKEKQLGEMNASQKRDHLRHATELQHLHERKHELEDQLKGNEQQLYDMVNELKEKNTILERQQGETAMISEQLEQLRGGSQERRTLLKELEEVKAHAADLQVRLDAVPPPNEIEILRTAAEDKHKLQTELDMAKKEIANLESANFKAAELTKLRSSVDEHSEPLTIQEETESDNGRRDAHIMDLAARKHVVEQKTEDTERKTSDLKEPLGHEGSQEPNQMQDEPDVEEKAYQEDVHMRSASGDGDALSEAAPKHQSEQQVHDIKRSPSPESISLAASPMKDERDDTSSSTSTDETTQSIESETTGTAVSDAGKAFTVTEPARDEQVVESFTFNDFADSESGKSNERANNEDDDDNELPGEELERFQSQTAGVASVISAEPALGPAHGTSDVALNFNPADGNVAQPLIIQEPKTVEKLCRHCEKLIQIPYFLGKTGNKIPKWEEHFKVCDKKVKTPATTPTSAKGFYNAAVTDPSSGDN